MRVAIADDHGIFRSALSRSLQDAGVDVVVSVGSGEELLAMLRNESVDVAIIDVAMPPTHTNEGLHTTREVKRAAPSTGVLVLSADTATPQAIELLRDFQDGIGYLRKDEVADVDDLCAMLVRLSNGEQVVGRSVVNRLLQAPRQNDILQRLSKQENEVLRLMAEGYSNSGIARRLHLAARTVEDHVTRIFTKLGITTEAEAPGPAGADSNRRVLAVLAWLRFSTGPQA